MKYSRKDVFTNSLRGTSLHFRGICEKHIFFGPARPPVALETPNSAQQSRWGPYTRIRNEKLPKSCRFIFGPFRIQDSQRVSGLWPLTPSWQDLTVWSKSLSKSPTGLKFLYVVRGPETSGKASVRRRSDLYFSIGGAWKTRLFGPSTAYCLQKNGPNDLKIGMSPSFQT